MDWQPIESAPKDRLFLLAYISGSGPRVCEARFHPTSWQRLGDAFHFRFGAIGVKSPDLLGWCEMPKWQSPEDRSAESTFDLMQETGRALDGPLP